jgi:hypothetical protein
MRKLFEMALIVFCISLIGFMVIPYTSIDPKLLPYDQQYLAIVQQYCKPNQYLHPWQKTIRFEDIKDHNNIANCETNQHTTFKVTYSIYNWNQQNEDDRFSTAFHEFTHCYFGADHSQDPSNFMYAYSNPLTKEVVIQQLTDYLKEKCK